MYENGNKIGIMGDEYDTPASSTSPLPVGSQEPIGEVIGQAINEVSEKSSTLLSYKPDTTPPAE